MEKITIALDWTPNTNHAGILIAQQNKLYAQAGLEVIIISPETDNYALTPARKLANGTVDLAISSSETVLTYRTADNPVLITAIATLIQNDTSAIATLASSGISRPMQLDGKIYASYGARFEDTIISQMVKNDGGSGNIELCYPEKLDIWQNLLEGKVDATWIFMGWEGALAKMDAVNLNVFTMDDYGIPYGYTPVILSTEALIETKREVFKKFLAVTEVGYQYAVQRIDEATKILVAAGISDIRNQNLIRTSLQMLQPHFLNESLKWGNMEFSKWHLFVQWLVKNKLMEENSHTLTEKLFINL